MLTGTYDYGLVALSVLVAILTSYAALLLAARVKASAGSVHRAWLVSGSAAMGVGIWSMHYTGTLACALPFRVLFHWPTVLASLLSAASASFVALFIASRKRVSLREAALANAAMGALLAAAFYAGIAAIRAPARCEWSWPVAGAAAFLAVATACVWNWLAFHLREEKPEQALQRKAGAALMGQLLALTHYAVLGAAHFSASGWPGNLAHAVSVSSLGIGALVISVLVTLGWVITTALFDRRLKNESAKLDQSERLYSDLLDSAEIIVWQMSFASGRFTLVTRQTEEILGIAAETWISEADFWADHLHPDDRAVAEGAIADATELRTAQTFEHRMRAADGHYKWLRTSVRLVDREGHRYLIGVMLDVTARMMIEAALHEERGLFDALMDTLPDNIYFKDAESCFLRVNRAQADHLGSPSSLRVIGMSDADFFGAPHALKALADEQEIMRTGQPLLDIEEEELFADGRKRWVTTSKMPLRNLNGAIVGTFGVSRDITARKAADEALRERSRELAQANEELRREMEERRLLESQLLQAQKLEAIGQLAAGVAHEINTPIQYVGDNCQFLADSFRQLETIFAHYERALGRLRDSGLDGGLVAEAEACISQTDLGYLRSEIPVAVAQSTEGVQRIAKIVRAMKEFAHPGSGRKEAVDLNHAIENTLTVCRNEWKYVAEAETELDQSLPPAQCLPGEMNQVLLNLVVNAAHAIERARQGQGKGKIVVSTKRDGRWAEIRVADDGTGIPPAIQPRIFDPFFTTKEVGKGTGQGLTLARNIVVRKHGGTLSFETGENAGTTFIIRIPISGQAEEAVEAESLTPVTAVEPQTRQ